MSCVINFLHVKESREYNPILLTQPTSAVQLFEMCLHFHLVSACSSMWLIIFPPQNAILTDLIKQKSHLHPAIQQVDLQQLRKDTLAFCKKICPPGPPFIVRVCF